MKPSYTVISGTVLGFMFLITLLAYWYQARLFPTQVMSNDIATLASIFEKINETCGIVDFQGDRINIDFLNVISFEGSEVKDIILTKETSITDLIKNKALVDPSGRPLALPIKTLMVSPSEIFGDLFMYAANKALVSDVNT